jgi:hypothetical protein
MISHIVSMISLFTVCDIISMISHNYDIIDMISYTVNYDIIGASQHAHIVEYII